MGYFLQQSFVDFSYPYQKCGRKRIGLLNKFKKSNMQMCYDKHLWAVKLNQSLIHQQITFQYKILLFFCAGPKTNTLL